MGYNIPLDYYKTFYTVVKHGSMSLAAKELFISQPAVSMAIKQLEKELGSVLLIRTKNGVKASVEGQVLLSYLENAFKLIDIAQEKHRQTVHLEAGEINIGASDTLSRHFLLPYLEKFNAEYPGINIRVTNRTTSETMQLLKSGQVDIGFVNLPVQDDSFLVRKCICVHDVLICGKKLFEKLKNGITAQELMNYPLIMLEKASNTRCYIDDFMRQRNIVLKPKIELGSYDLLHQFAIINLGLAFAVREFAMDEVDNENLFFIDMKPEIPARHIGMLRLKNIPLSKAGEQFTRLLDSGF